MFDLLSRVKDSLFNALGGAAQNVGHFIQQDINRDPVVQSVNTIRQAAPQIQQSIQQIAPPVQRALSSFWQDQISKPIMPELGALSPKPRDIPSLWQGPAQFGAGVALSARNAVTGENNSSYTPDNFASKLLLGSEPVKNLFGQGEDVSQGLQKVGLNKNISDKAGVPGVLAVGALNFLGAGEGENTVARAIAKSKTLDEFGFQIAKDKNLATEVGTILNDAKSPINTLEDLWKAGKSTVVKNVEQVIPKATTEVLQAGKAGETLQSVGKVTNPVSADLLNAQSEVSKLIKETPKTFSGAKGILKKSSEYLFGDKSLQGARGVVANDSPAGKTIMGIVNTAESKAADLIGQAKAALYTATKDLSDNELNTLADVIEGKAQPISEAQANAVNVWRGIREDVHNLATESGMSVGKIEDYFPHYGVKDGRQALDASSYIDRGANLDYGNLVKSRETDLPYEKNPNVLFDYIDHAYNNIVKRSYFGEGDKNLYTLADKSANPNQVKSILDSILSKGQKGGIGDQIASGITSLEATKLNFTSPLTNLTQQLSAVARTDAPTALKTYGRMIANPEETLLNAIKAREIDPQVGGKLLARMQELQGAGIGRKWLEFIRFNASENLNRVFSVNAGMEYANKLVSKAQEGSGSAVRELERLGIKDLSSLTEQDIIRAGRKISEETQFATKPGALPQAAGTPVGRVMTQFKSFAYKQTGFIKDQAIRVTSEASKGNLKPLASLLAAYGVGSAIEGEIINDVRSLVTNKKREDNGLLNRYIGNVVSGSSLGLLDNAGALLGQYGASGIVSTIGGPAVGDAFKLATGTADAYKGATNFDPTKGLAENLDPNNTSQRALLKDIPGVGTTLANTLIPNSYVDNLFGGVNNGLSEKNNDYYKELKQTDPQAADEFKKGNQAVNEPAKTTNLFDVLTGTKKASADTNKISYRDNKGSIKTIDLSPPTKGQGIDAFTNKTWNYTKAREVWKSNITQEQKDSAFEKLGVDPADVRYDYLAHHTVDEKSQYILSKDLPHDQLIERILTGRVESKSGVMFATNGVLADLVDAGVISKSEEAYLKKIKIGQDGKIATSSLVGTGLSQSQIRAKINSLNSIFKARGSKKVKPIATKVPTAPKLNLTKLKSAPSKRLTKQLFTSY